MAGFRRKTDPATAKKHLQLYERLFPSNTTDDTANQSQLLQYFPITIGWANFSLLAVQHALDLIPKTRTWVTPHKSMTGTILPFVGGEALDPVRKLSKAQRRTALRNIVAIYDHMFKLRFVHCDISFRHFWWSDQDTVALIDFDRVQLNLKQKNAVEMRYRQVWQLLNLIGMICDPPNQESFTIFNNVCGGASWRARPPTDEFLDLLNPTLQKCDLFAGPSTLSFNEMDLNNTEGSLMRLKRWTKPTPS